jgi:farnesyl diphosphate synthase
MNQLVVDERRGGAFDRQPDVEQSLLNFSEMLNRRMAELFASNRDARSPPQLVDAIRHAAHGGKRFRPFLTVECAKLFGVPASSSLDVACAIECFHCHSLVLDDLPAMDDDSIRRGLPTAHVAFGEATAILAASCLSLMAFEILAKPATHRDPQVRTWLIAELARIAGSGGMAGGQLLDLMSEGNSHTAGLALVEQIHLMKTASLIRYASVAGAKLAGAPDRDAAALAHYGSAIGLAFQIADDLQDADGSNEVCRPGQDAQKGKATYVTVVGPDAARILIKRSADTALRSIARFGERGSTLAQIAHFVVQQLD